MTAPRAPARRVRAATPHASRTSPKVHVTAAPVGAAPVILRPGAPGTPALATFETKFGPTDVLDIRRVGGGLACTIRWSAEQGVTTGELSIDRRDVRPGWPGFQAYLRADDGQEFGFLIEWDPAVEGREHIREWTGTDRLDLDRSFRDGAILERYDVNGRQVRSFARESLEPGRYHFDWNGADDHGAPLPAGVYLLRYTAPGYRATQRVALVR